MIVSTDLFDLIRSLSKTEKSYFKRNSSTFSAVMSPSGGQPQVGSTARGGGGTNYLQLFDAISAQDSYNEKELIRHFKGEKFVRQFSVAKNYLYNRILDTMQAYHSSVLSEVHGLMNRSEYLFEKGLYKQADKLLRMAEKIARKHELHSILISIYELQKFDQAIKKREPQTAEKNIGWAQEENILLNNHLAFLKLLAQTQHVYNLFGKTKNKKYLVAFKKIMSSPLLKEESRALTFNSKRRFYDIHAIYNSILGNEENAYHFSKKIISLFDLNPEKKKNAAIRYAGYISNMLLFCHYLRKYTEMDGYLQKLIDIKSLLTSKYEKARLFQIYTTNYLSLYCTTGRFDVTEKLLPSIIAELPEHEKKLAPIDKFLIFGNIAITFFGLEDYKNCLVWINKIRNELPANTRPDLDSEIMLMNIIVHNELKHEELIPHLVTSYYRFLSKKELATKPEKYLMAFLRKLPGANTETKLTHSMIQLKTQLDAYKKKEGSNPDYTPFFFDIISWLESKIRKISFSGIIQEHIKNIKKN